MGGDPISHKTGKPKTIADLINLHIADLMEFRKLLRRSKFAVLKSLKQDLGATRIGNLDRAALIRYGMKRARNGAGPVTLSIDLSICTQYSPMQQPFTGLASILKDCAWRAWRSFDLIWLGAPTSEIDGQVAMRSKIYSNSLMVRPT